MTATGTVENLSLFQVASVAAKSPRTPAPLVPANIGEGLGPSQPFTMNQGGRPTSLHNVAVLRPLEVLEFPATVFLVVRTLIKVALSDVAQL